MKRKHIFRAIALILSVSLMANTIPAYALPQTTEESDGFQMPEGIPLPTEPPSLEKPSGGSGISEDELALEPPPVESEPNESPILEEVEDRREVNTKHFLTADHTYLAAVYPSAVHYEEDGVWKEIDNTLQLQSDETGSEYYGNTASDTHVRFSKYGTEDTLASIERGGLTLSWGLTGSPAQEEAAETTEEEVSADENAVSESVPDPEASSNGSAAEALEVNTGSEKTRKEADEADSYAVLGAEENAASQEAADENPASEAAEGAKVSSPEATGEEVSPDMAAAEESPSDAAVPPAEAPPSVSTFQVIQPPQAVMPLAAEEPAMLETEEEIQVYNETCTQLPALTSVGYYPEILPDIDLSYLVTSNTVKEFVTIKSVSAAGTPLSFRLAHPGLGLELTEDGRILAHPLEKPEDIAFEFSVPYMYDAAEAESYEVAYSLAAGDGSSILTLVPDQAWLADPERVYPVVIDPSTETDKRTSSIQDTFVQSKYPNQSGVSQNGSFYVGDSYPYGVSRALIRFPNLPTLSKGDMVYYAKMYVWQREFSTEGQTYFNIAAHMVTSDWDPYTVNWNNQPSFDGAALDYFRAEEVASGNTIYVTPRGVDITKAVRSWYAGSNYGIILKSVNEAPAYKEVARFFASNYPDGYASGISAEQHPGAYIYYKNAAGVEDYWSYHEQSAGRAGMGYTNDFTGNQVFIHGDAETTGTRLPASVSHVYNMSSSDQSSRFGNGWRLSCMQELVGTGNNEFPYKYIDADGTEHYFYRDAKDGNKLKDEDGLGWTITQESASDYDIHRKMENKDGYQMVFGADGYLRREIDTNGNTILYQYGPHANGNFIGYIVDPTGARIDFSYTENYERLAGITDSAVRTTSFEYDAAGNLIKINDPDGASSTYSYEGNLLKEACSPDGYSVCYEYANDFRVPRVSKISERCGADTGQSLKISYQNGSTTVFEDCGLDGDLAAASDNLITTYNFDNMGRVTDIYDADGNANSYEYYKENLTNNKLKQSGSTQRTVYNYLINPNFAPDTADTWYAKVENMDTGIGVDRVDNTGYVADTSIRVGKSVSEGSGGAAQQVSLPAGEYTFSSYVKTSEIAATSDNSGASLQVITSSGGQFAERFVTGTTDASVDRGWERLSVTFQLNQAETVTVWCGIFSATGHAWFDCLQLEEGNVANRVNMARNAGFEYLKGDQTLQNWGLNGGTQTTGHTSPGRFGDRCGTIAGEAGISKNIAHGIRVKGKEGDIFSLSGWVKTDAIPGHYAALAAAIIYTTGDPKWVVFNVNPYVSGWQYLHGIVPTDDENPTTNREYQAIHFYIFHEDQLNPAYYDGIQLTKDNGQSYVYDSNGNLTSASNAAESSGFVYDGNQNLSRISNPDGTSFDYIYDQKKNLTSAKSSEGVGYYYSYDANGNPTQVKVQGGANHASITDGRTYYIRSKTAGKYLDVEGASNEDVRNVRLNSFHGGTNQQWMVRKASDGYYQLVTQIPNSGQVLGVDGGKNELRANVAIYNNYFTDATKFKFKAVESGYQILPKCADDTKAVDFYQSNVHLWTVDEPINQIWYFEPVSGEISAAPEVGKIYSIRSRFSGQLLDINGISTEPSAMLMQCHPNGGLNQQFILETAGEDTYYLAPHHAPEMALEEPVGNGLVTQQNKIPESTRQVFRFEKQSNGTYRITSTANPAGGLTVKDASLSAGAEVWSETYTGTENQQWILEEVSGTMTSSATYTADGRNISSVTDARGGTASNTYDAGNRLLTAETDALGNTVNYTYDPNNDRLTQVSDVNGTETVTSSYGYTGDQLTSITHNGFTYTVNYDGYGNQTSTYVGSQMLSSNTYLPHNGLLSYSDYGNGGRVGYAYDKWGRTIEKKYNDQAAYRYVYDAYGSLARKESLLDQTVTDYQYDMIGRIVGMDSTDGQTLRIAYDSKNRTDYVVSKVGDSSTKTRYLYGNTGANQKAGLIYGVEIDDTPAVSYAYDNMARRTGRTLDLDTDYVTSYGYLAGNEAGTTTALVERLQSGPETWWYAYDAVGNITSISKGETKEAAILQEQYVYDGLGQIIRENSKSQDKTITYRYDGGGNLTERKEYTYSTGELGDPVQTVAYGYGDMNWKDKLTSYDGTEITYDAIGNPLSYLGKTLIWQNGRQLASLNDTDLTVNYAYDDSGIRIQKTVNETETKFYLNGTVILTQMTGNERMDFLYDEAGDLLGFKYDGNSYYYIRNLQSDITGILNSAGEQIVSYAYDAWGKLLSVAGSAADTIGKKNPFRYRGYYYDTETGLYYLNSRYYNPEIGRYLNADKAIPGVGGDIRGYNLFSYCMNNPINMSDPNGQWPKWIQGVANAVENLVKKAINKAINNVKAALSSKPKVSQTTNKRPYTGKPGSTYKAPNGDTRTYGPDGKPKHDYDHSDHGYPDKHPHDENGGHNHDWENGVRGPAYSVNNDPLAGAALITVCAIGFFLVAADDITVIGIADNFLLGPLGAGVSKGLIMIFG